MTEQLAIFAQHIVNGLTLGSVYVLIALSITIIFGLTGMINFAVGELLMLAAFIVLTVVNAGLPFGLALAIAVLAMALAGIFLESWLFRWTLVNPVTGFIVSLGLILVLQALAIEIWGTTFQSIAQPLTQTFRFGGVVVGAHNLVVLGAALLAITALLAWLQLTRDGRALRAASEDREAAYLMGIPATRLTTLAFAIGVALAGLAGVLVSSMAVVHPFMSENYLLKAFAVAIMGGLGSLTGVFVAGILIALVESLAQGYLPIEWTNVYVYAVVIVALLLRPGGLFGVQRG